MLRNALIALTLPALVATAAEPSARLLLRQPDLSRDRIVFCHAGDLWTVAREGGEAKRLTTGTGIESDPKFSPDGKWVAFTGEYDGNVDVYVVPSEGGIPRRLTYHPGPDRLVGWSPDGKKVLFASVRQSETPR